MSDSIYRIEMDRKWSLRDLFTLPYSYSQNYAFVYCFDTQLDPRDADRINYALQGYPWRGGYSYVNIYTVLQHQVPADERPQISSIQYASPGWLDLLLNPDVALQVAKSVGILLGAVVSAAATYQKINKILTSVNKVRSEARNQQLKLSRAEAAELSALTKLLANDLGFESLEKLTERTGDPEVSTRLLMAHYRRMKQLGNFVVAGKAGFPNRLRGDA